MTEEYYPPVGFYFVVGFDKANNNENGSFQEVLGISMETETEAVAEGGENRFQWRLPAVNKSSNLVLKRGVMVQKSGLVNWIQDTLEGGPQKPIKPKTIYVTLMEADDKAIMKWCFYNARPVKWNFSGMGSTDNHILTESIEFAYNYFEVSYINKVI